MQSKIESIKPRMEVSRDDMMQSLFCIEDDIARTGIRLFYGKGMTWDEVADVVKCSTDEVRERVDKALDAGT